MQQKSRIVFNHDNPKHLIVLDRLVDWLFMDEQSEPWSESRSVLPIQPILGPTLTAEDIERSHHRIGQTHTKTSLTPVGRALYPFTNDFYTGRPFTDIDYFEPLTELQKAILSYPDGEVDAFMAFYDAMLEVCPIPPLVRYIHSLLEPSYQAKELNHAS